MKVNHLSEETNKGQQEIVPANEGVSSTKNSVALHESIRNTTGATRHQGCVAHESKLMQIKNTKKKTST